MNDKDESNDVKIEHLSETEKKELLKWAKNVKGIQKDKSLNFKQKLGALKELNNSDAFKTSIKYVNSYSKHYWKHATWAEKLGIIGGGGALALAGIGGAGVAALGGAIGLPLFLLTASGGTLIGTIVDRLDK